MLRVKLTFWYVGALATVLLAFSVGFYVLFEEGLRQRLDDNLQSAIQIAALTLNHETEEHHGKEMGEANFGLVLDTMQQTSFPTIDISVWEGSRLVAEKPGLANVPVDQLRSLLPSVEGNGVPFTATLTLPDGRHRLIGEKVLVPSSNTSYAILASETAEPLEAELLRVIRILAITVPVCLIGAALGGYFLVRRSLMPVLDMARAAEQISSYNLSRRLPVENSNDELGLLAQTFNRLFERLNNAFKQQRQFMADASHELRTPIFVALTASQVSLQNGSLSPEDFQETLEVVQAQMLRLRRVVEDMFTLAQADSGEYRLSTSLFYLDEVLVESVKAGQVLGNAKGVEVVLDCEIAGLSFTGDEGLIRQLWLILIDNAVKYTPSGGCITIGLRQTESQYQVEINDTGQGILPQDQGRIFDRFYRVDKSRSRREPGSGGGAGLGLAIARWIVERHSGNIVLKQSGPTGSTFQVLLPKV